MKDLLVKTSNWKFILPCFIVFVGCLVLFQSYQSKMNGITEVDSPMIDMRPSYDAAEILDFFSQLKDEGRHLHRQATAVVDSVFPFAYGILFILLIAFFIKKIFGPASNWLYLSLFPLLLFVMDFRENFNTLSMLDSYPELTEEVVASASKVTGIKSLLVDLSLGLIVLLALVWVVKWIMNRNK